jgi:hypothetical protein
VILCVAAGGIRFVLIICSAVYGNQTKESLQLRELKSAERQIAFCAAASSILLSASKDEQWTLVKFLVALSDRLWKFA